MIDFLANPVDVMDFDDDFGVGESTIFSFQASENSFQTLTIIGDTFDVKILTSDEKNNIDNSYKNKADISWVNTIAGENVIHYSLHITF